jgi:hypothetical protein
MTARGEVRGQFHHVIDVAPTVLAPTRVNGVEQRHMDGVSMLCTLDDGKAADRRTTQYLEMSGNCAICHDGWVAAARHYIPWLSGVKLPDLKDDVRELYHESEDFSEFDNLATQNPQKPRELQDLYTTEAARNHVLPIDDCRVERFDPAVAGRPELLGGRNALTVYEGMKGTMEHTFIKVKGAHHTVATGRHTILWEFIPDEAKPGTGGKSVLIIDGKRVADVGVDGETKVSNDCAEGDNALTGRIVRVTLEQR